MPAAPKFRSEFLRTFVERGAYYDCSAPEDLDALFPKERVTAYIGFDCTARSMHIGNLVQLMTLRRLQQAGHRPILLMGGGTTKLGDPSGKDEMRKILSTEQIEENKNSMVAGISHLLKFGNGPADAIMVDNAEWLDKLEYIPFLRDIGQHFSVNRMLTMESVKLRLEREQPLSFLEFNYMVLPGLRLCRALQAVWLPAAILRQRPVGQCHFRHRSRSPGGERPAFRPVDAADHDRLRRQDGQERFRRGVAEQGHAERL